MVHTPPLSPIPPTYYHSENSCDHYGHNTRQYPVAKSFPTTPQHITSEVQEGKEFQRR